MRVRQAVIPAAGLGTRFLPATKAQPKEMLAVVDKPIIQYVVEEALEAGIESIVLVTSRGKNGLEDHFDAAPELERHLAKNGREDLLEQIQALTEQVQVCAVRQASPRGLGDSIRTVRPFLAPGPFAVMLPDELFLGPRPCLAALLEVHEETGSSVVAYKEVALEETSRYGILDPEPVKEGLCRARDMVEKPDPASAPSRLAIVGRYILTDEVFSYLEDLGPGYGGEVQLTDALRLLAREREVYGCEALGKRFDVGSKIGFLQANVELGLRHPEVGEAFHAYLQNLLREDSIRSV